MNGALGNCGTAHLQILVSLRGFGEHHEKIPWRLPGEDQLTQRAADQQQAPRHTGTLHALGTWKSANGGHGGAMKKTWRDMG